MTQNPLINETIAQVGENLAMLGGIYAIAACLVCAVLVWAAAR